MNQVIFGNVIRTTEPEITAEKPLALKAGVTMGTDPKSLATKEYVDGQNKSVINIVSNASVTPTGNALENEVFITALAEATTINIPSGTAINGNTLLFRIYSVAEQTLTWNAIYKAFFEALPTTTIAGKEMYLAFVYNGRTSKWDYVAKTLEV